LAVTVHGHSARAAENWLAAQWGPDLVWKGIASFNPKLGFVWQVFRSDKMTLPQEAGGKPISHFSLDKPRPI